MSERDKELVALCQTRAIARSMMRSYAMLWRLGRLVESPPMPGLAPKKLDSTARALETAKAFRDKAKEMTP